MGMTDAIGRVAEIRTTLQQLSTTPAAAAPAATSGSSAAASALASGGDFASTLAALTGTTAAGGTTATASGSGTADSGKVLDAVQKYLGLPYVWGGNDPAVGLDCSSFVQNVYKDLGYSLPRVTWDQMNAGTEVASMAAAQAGDLLISHDGGHVAIYLGNGKAVDAPQPGQTIQIRDAWETDANLTTIRRILPTETAGAASPSAVTDMVASARAAQASLLGASA
ncbi:C40 family peptidase [Arthrobacter sp. zg-ZUI100]|uniref:C40 family peptidase n=1 Tax=Arthrobacter jiangjiafuii TaxID=2817475 RepID=UPI001AED92A8|nr:C40 family peptidase [Arthrobacter jiangjiafuii]MBP3037689.1 C40 family peptidase [Arthrobacter jiangjiafuii]